MLICNSAVVEISYPIFVFIIWMMGVDIFFSLILCCISFWGKGLPSFVLLDIELGNLFQKFLFFNYQFLLKSCGLSCILKSFYSFRASNFFLYKVSLLYALLMSFLHRMVVWYELILLLGTGLLRFTVCRHARSAWLIVEC